MHVQIFTSFPHAEGFTREEWYGTSRETCELRTPFDADRFRPITEVRRQGARQGWGWGRGPGVGGLGGSRGGAGVGVGQGPRGVGWVQGWSKGAGGAGGLGGSRGGARVGVGQGGWVGPGLGVGEGS